MSKFDYYIKEAKDIVGEENVLSSKIDKIIYSRDNWPLLVFKELRGELPPLPRVIIQPSSTEEVSQLVKLANKYKVKLIIFGGGSGVLGGTLSTKDFIIIDLSRLNRIIEINIEDQYVVVEAGVILEDLEKELNKLGYTTRHIPQSILEAQIGGLISTKSTGQFSTKYGGIEQHLLSLEVVLPNGEIIETKKIPRRAVGPKIEELFIGSEGIFGIITKATLKIYRLPERQELICYSFNDFETGLKAIKELISLGIYPPVTRLNDETETNMRYPEFEELIDRSLLLLLFEGLEDIVESEVRVAKRILSKYGSEFSDKPMRKWLNERFNVINELSKLISLNAVYDTIEISGLWSQLSKIHKLVKKRVSAIDNILIIMTHASHFYHNGGCLYFTIGGIPDKTDLETYYINLWTAVMTAVLEVGGSISHHHGIGIMRLKWVKEDLGSISDLLLKFKSILDPKGVLNYGRLI